MDKPPSLWRNRDYVLLWSGQVISTAGSGASSIVTPLLILALTNSPASAGLASALYALPYLLFSLPAGALIDRWDRKRVMMLCDVGRALALGSVPLALWLGALKLWHIYVVVFIEGTLFVFFNVAEVAALPRVVPTAQLPEAAAQNEAAFGAASIIGPPLGTFLYQTFGRGVPFLVDAISYAVSVLTLSFIRVEFQAVRTAEQRNLLAEITEGIRWLWHAPLIRFIAFLTGGVNAAFAAGSLIVIVLAQELGAKEAVIGVIVSAASVGSIAGAMLGGQLQKRFRFGQIILGTVWAITLLFPLYAVVPHYVWLGVLGALISMAAPIYDVVQFSYRLSLIPDELQGRVNSTFRLLAYGFQPLGVALAGFLLEGVGATLTVLFFTAWMLLWALLTLLNRHVREARPILPPPA